MNLVARESAIFELTESTHPFKFSAECRLSCCIGKAQINATVLIKDKYGQLLEKKSNKTDLCPTKVIGAFGLQNPKYALLCERGLFGVDDDEHPWES